MTEAGYRDSAAPEIIAELRDTISRVEAERRKLAERLHYAGLDLPNADSLPVWVAPYINWFGVERGSRCPGCDLQRFDLPRVKVHACDFVTGDHVHVLCRNCHETACWREKR